MSLEDIFVKCKQIYREVGWETVFKTLHIWKAIARLISTQFILEFLLNAYIFKLLETLRPTDCLQRPRASDKYLLWLGQWGTMLQVTYYLIG